MQQPSEHSSCVSTRLPHARFPSALMSLTGVGRPAALLRTSDGVSRLLARRSPSSSIRCKEPGHGEIACARQFRDHAARLRRRCAQVAGSLTVPMAVHLCTQKQLRGRQSQSRTISKHGRWRPCAEAGDSTHRSEPFVGHDIRVSAEQVRERVDSLDPCVTRVEFFICGDSSDRPENAARESVRFA